MADQGKIFSTNVPARLDRLPWSRFHWLVVAAPDADDDEGAVRR